MARLVYCAITSLDGFVADRGGLVDELHLIMSPVLVGGGTPALPLGVRLDLELVEQGRFANGVVRLHHRVG